MSPPWHVLNLLPQRVFKLAEIDRKAVDMVSEQEDLDKILQTSVPGLVSKSQRRLGNQNSKGRVSAEGSATHKLLVDSSVFNIAILLPPSLSFLQRLKDIVPQDSDIAVSTLTSFLDDFLLDVFLPQLEETATELCLTSFMELGAFQQDSQWSQRGAQPVFKVHQPSILFAYFCLNPAGDCKFFPYCGIILQIT